MAWRALAVSPYKEQQKQFGCKTCYASLCQQNNKLENDWDGPDELCNGCSHPGGNVSLRRYDAPNGQKLCALCSRVLRDIPSGAQFDNLRTAFTIEKAQALNLPFTNKACLFCDIPLRWEMPKGATKVMDRRVIVERKSDNLMGYMCLRCSQSIATYARNKCNIQGSKSAEFIAQLSVTQLAAWKALPAASGGPNSKPYKFKFRIAKSKSRSC